MRRLHTILFAALTILGIVGIGSAQSRGGVITGIARDSDGGVLPGVTVTITAGEFQRKVVTTSNGGYRFGDLAAGTYRLQADLVGFRRTTVEGVVVGSSSEVQRDLVLRIGILSGPDLLAMPTFPNALRAATAIAHLRVTRVVGVQLIGPSESWLTTEHIAQIITVVKGTGPDLSEGKSLHFWQTYAGEWTEDGKRIVGETSPYRVGDEFVGLFTREEDGKLVESVAGRFMYRVVAGKVVWSGRPTPGIQDGMPVDAFIAALRQIMALE